MTEFLMSKHIRAIENEVEDAGCKIHRSRHDGIGGVMLDIKPNSSASIIGSISIKPYMQGLELKTKTMLSTGGELVSIDEDPGGKVKSTITRVMEKKGGEERNKEALVIKMIEFVDRVDEQLTDSVRTSASRLTNANPVMAITDVKTNCIKMAVMLNSDNTYTVTVPNLSPQLLDGLGLEASSLVSERIFLENRNEAAE